MLGVSRRVGLLSRSLARPSAVSRLTLRTSPAAAVSLWRRTFAGKAAAADDSKADADAEEEHMVRTAKAAPIGARPKLFDTLAATHEEHAQGLKATHEFTTANRQTLPWLPAQPVDREAPERKPLNKAESKLFAHLRRLRLRRERQTNPAPPRPYFPPVRVNHTPKLVHAAASDAKTAAAATSPLSARLQAFIAATAATAATEPLPNSKAQLQIPAGADPLAGPVAAATDADAKAAPATRFAIIDINSKQHKVVEGDLLMVDRMSEVSVGDRLQFDRILMVASKTYTVIGRPFIPYAKVKMTCEEHAYTRHMIIFKKHRRKGYRKTKGYRHKVTLLRVDTIDYDADADATTELVKPEDLPTAQPQQTVQTAQTTAGTAPLAAAAAAAATADGIPAGTAKTMASPVKRVKPTSAAALKARVAKA